MHSFATILAGLLTSNLLLVRDKILSKPKKKMKISDFEMFLPGAIPFKVANSIYHKIFGKFSKDRFGRHVRTFFE